MPVYEYEHLNAPCGLGRSSNGVSPSMKTP
jgi:hypothetical protein